MPDFGSKSLPIILQPGESCAFDVALSFGKETAAFEIDGQCWWNYRGRLVERAIVLTAPERPAVTQEPADSGQAEESDTPPAETTELSTPAADADVTAGVASN